MAVPSVRATGTAVFGTAGTLAPTVPTQAADDVLLCCIGSSANASVTPTHSMTGGWALLQSGVITTGVIRARASVYWKRTAGAEGTPTVTVTPTGSTACHHSAVIISVQAVNTGATPYEGASANQAAGASALALTLTTTAANELGFLVTHHADNIATGVSDGNAYADLVATDNATGIDGFLSVMSKAVGNGAGQGATVTFASGGTAVGIAGVAFALLEASAAESTERRAEATLLEAVLTGRRAELAAFDRTELARRAELASLEAVVLVRRAETATLDATAVARRAALATLEAIATSRRAATSLLEAEDVGRRAVTALLEATATGRRAEATFLEAVVTERRAESTMLEALTRARRGELTEMLATVTARRADGAELEAAVVDRRSELTMLMYSGSAARAELTLLTALLADRRAEGAVLYAPRSYVSQRSGAFSYRAYYQLLQPGVTVFAHSLRYLGAPACPVRVVVTLRQSTLSGSSVYVADYDAEVIRVCVVGDEPVRCDVFAQLTHTILEPLELDE